MINWHSYAPDEVLLKDRPLQLTVAVWGALSFAVLFWYRLQQTGVIK